MSKGKTLIKLTNSKSRLNIPFLKVYKVKDFVENEEKVLIDIRKNFKKRKVAIRSSHISEDKLNLSNAGKFKSILNVDLNKKLNFYKKVYDVISSYKLESKNIESQEFIIQEMVKDIKISGVILTKDINNYNNSYLINYHVGSDSSVVTSGKQNTKTIRYYHNKKYKINSPFQKLIKIVRNLEKKFKYPLDVEFIIDKKKKIYIVQVRRLVLDKNILKKNKFNFLRYLDNLEKKIEKLQLPHHTLLGRKNFFGVMPDWNPAEIIGKKPRPLALSLYQELITDHVWAENRVNYGYKNLKQFHLMTTFYGTPYIDVRIDFNSWLPNDLEHNVQKKIINYYLNRFEKNISFHDKIEKDIIFSSYNFSTQKKIKKKLKKILSNAEIQKFISSLKKINMKAILEKVNDLKKISLLQKKQKMLEESKLYYIDKIYFHTEECKHYGTLPFAGLARCGFIAMDLLNSLVENKVINNIEKNYFLESIKTISSNINQDFLKDSKTTFLRKYGHLRPNTYEITSDNYRQGFSNYFNLKKDSSKIIKSKFKLSNYQNIRIKRFIKNSKIYGSPEKLFEFIKSSIEAREYSKYIFSKSIDLIFENLIKFGKKYNISKEDLSFLDFQEILKAYFNLSSSNIIPKLKESIKKNKKEYLLNLKINLPDVIIHKKDLYIQKIQSNSPNFITDNIVSEKKILLDNTKKKNKLNGKIVCIESADPGYDFIFSYKIKGLVTKFGGYNSHMAIRCSELKIPAAIGVGEGLFSSIKDYNRITIDCKNKKINTV